MCKFNVGDIVFIKKQSSKEDVKDSMSGLPIHSVIYGLPGIITEYNRYSVYPYNVNWISKESDSFHEESLISASDFFNLKSFVNESYKENNPLMFSDGTFGIISSINRNTVTIDNKMINIKNMVINDFVTRVMLCTNDVKLRRFIYFCLSLENYIPDCDNIIKDIDLYTKILKKKLKYLLETGYSEYTTSLLLEKLNSFKKLLKRDSILDTFINIKGMYDSINNNKKVLDINSYGEYIILSTKRLFYKDNRYENIPLGKFKIKIYNNVFYKQRIEAVSTDYQTLKNYSHPCISGNRVCTGEDFRRELSLKNDSGEYDMMVYGIINFLEEPNYGTPYICLEALIYSRTKLEFKTKDERDWFNLDKIYKGIEREDISWKKYNIFSNMLESRKKLILEKYKIKSDIQESSTVLDSNELQTSSHENNIIDSAIEQAQVNSTIYNIEYVTDGMVEGLQQAPQNVGTITHGTSLINESLSMINDS